MENKSILHIPVEKKKPSKKDGPLEKETRRFNKQVKEIEELQSEYNRLQTDNEQYHDLFLKQVHPLLLEIAAAQVAFINKLEKIFYGEKFSKNVERSFIEFAIPVLQDASMYEDAAKEKLDNYRVWQNSLSGKTAQDPVLHSSADEAENNEQHFDEGYVPGEKHEEVETVPDLDKRSLSELYKELAKQIHPDLEQEEEIKLVKEQLMKKLIAAKEKEDIYAMLQIRQEAAEINDSENDQNPYTLQMLKRYNGSLKKKLEQLRREIHKMIFENFHSKEAFLASGKKLPTVEIRIKNQMKDLKELHENLQTNTRIISSGTQLKELLGL